MAKRENFMVKTWDWLRNHPVVCHLLVMMLVFICLAIAAYITMALGTRHSARRTVPNFELLSLGDAEYYANRRDLQVVVKDSVYYPEYVAGVVLDQQPRSGEEVKPGRKIYVTINSVIRPKAEVPYVTGLTLRIAVDNIRKAGFAIDRIVYADDDATDRVLAEFVNDREVTKDAKIEAEVGSGVVLKVGLKPDLALSSKIVSVPQVENLTLAEAKMRLWKTGLNVGSVEFDDGISVIERSSARVYYQSIMPTREVMRGDKVSLSLTCNEAKAENAESMTKLRLEEELKAKLAQEAYEKEMQRQRDSLANIQPLLNEENPHLQFGVPNIDL